MYPASFEYHAPGSVREALGLLGKLGDDELVMVKDNDAAEDIQPIQQEQNNSGSTRP